MYPTSSSNAANKAASSPLIKPSPQRVPNKIPPLDEKTKKSPEKSDVPTIPNIFTPNLAANANQEQGGMDFAKLIHTHYLSDQEVKDNLLITALNEYKRVGYKRTLAKIVLMILVCLSLIAFTVLSIGCWSQHLELTEHLEVYDERYVKARKTKNSTVVEMDCPLVGFMARIWSPSSANVDLFGKIISIISIRKLMQLIVRLIRSIRLKTTTEKEAREHMRETQKDLNGLAESIVETLCEV